MRVGKPRTKREILALLRSERETLRGYGVRRLALFGSYARGRPRATSDVDLVVDLKEPSFDNFMRVTAHLERVLGTRVDVLTPQGIKGIRVKEVADRIRQSLVYV